MRDEQDGYDIERYFIPRNFKQEDTVLNGKINARRVSEAGLMGGFLWALENNLLGSVSPTALFVLFLCTAIPVCALALIGIAGYPLSTFLFIYFDFQKNKRKLHFKRIQIRQRKKVNHVVDEKHKETK